MSGGVLVFDMDGVLVDVTESYRESICRTVEHFTGRRIPRELAQDYKNRGGWNNDWALAQRISADLGCEVAYDTVVAYFQSIFLGPNGDGGDGLIARERWIARDGLIEGLAARYRLALFTGRPRAEATITLERFAPGVRFDPMVTEDDHLPEKPAPDGLWRIAALAGGAPVAYVGDTVDDARAARAAGVPFIGVAAADCPRRAELVALFGAQKALAVVEDVNGLGELAELGAGRA